MRKVARAQTRHNSSSVEAGRHALDAATTPQEVCDVAKMAELAGKWSKHQRDALAQQNAWAKLRIDALTKLGKVLPSLLTPHRPRKGDDAFRLKDAGISRDLSRLAQAVAGISETIRLRYFAEAERNRQEITLAGLLEKVDIVKRSQHFTSGIAAKRLYELVLKIIAEYGIKFDCWLEPSAGDGAFYDLLPTGKRLGIDIDPRRADIVRADFLSFNNFIPDVVYAAIGNPPWGENGVVKFFNCCADHCAVIAFLVPLSFERPHMINQLDRRFHLLHEEVSWRGQPPIAAALFQIWAHGDTLRETIESPSEHPDFEFLSRDRSDLREAADIVIRRIGVNAGNILIPSEVPRPDTAHWIKCRPGVDVENVRARFRAIEWSHSKSIDAAEESGARGYPSLSMGAVVDEYEACETRALPNIRYQDTDKIVQWLMADPEKAGKVCMALLERSSASPMVILYFTGHCLGTPG